MTLKVQRNGQENEISIAWQNLRYEALSGLSCHSGLTSRIKPILRRLNGYFEYHTLNGLMGPSGAGKTTLLNTLSGNVRSGLTDDSRIFLNSDEQSSVVSSFFIEQHVHETIFGRLTVSQILRYAFRFKNGLFSNSKSINNHIDSIMSQLLLPKSILDNCFDACSGGEQKRIAIAQELMSLRMPSLLFVDEPTTGLDSAAAFVVMSCLQQMALHNRLTVIVSIHLPSHEILCLFHKLYVLARGGLCIYSGPPDQIQSHLEGQIDAFNINQQHQQPIETLIKIACNGELDPNVTSLADQCLCTEFDKISTKASQLKRFPFGLPNVKKHFSISDLFLQICRQAQITFVANFRVFAYQILFYLFIHAILGTLFRHDMVLPDGCYQLDPENPNAHSAKMCTNQLSQSSALNENIAYHHYLFVIFGFISISTSSILFSSVVRVFQNEHRNRWYSVGVFYCSLTFVSLIEQSLLALLNASLTYFSTEQHAIDGYSINWTRFGHFFAAVWLNTVHTQSLGQLIGAVLSDQMLAIVVSLMSFTVMVIQDDYFFKTDQFDNAFQVGLANVLGMKYLTRYLVYIFYGIDRCNEQDGEVSLVLPEHLVDTNQIWFYIQRILVNVAVVRLVTLLYMYFRFNTFVDHPLVQMFIPKSRDEPNAECIPIDYCITGPTSSTLNGQTENDFSIQSAKSNQFECEDWMRNKTSIAWTNLSLYGSSSIYEIGSNSNYETRESKLILRNLSGHFCFGTLNALMGTSGAGKTSLLRTLNGQLKTRLSNDTQFHLSKYIKIQTCFITQEVSHHLLPGLTAKQMLVYASRLKNNQASNSSSIDHETIALKLLDELNLKTTRDTKVEKCSGGERKRLALAVELTSIQMPNLICIDEPTSGLDSNSAEIIVSCLQKLTQNHPITIIASIHQPNSEVLQMFDKLYILARGGVCVYSGPPSQITSHINQVQEMSQIAEPKLALENLIRQSCNGHEDAIVQKLQHQNEQLHDKNYLKETQLSPDGIPLNRQRFSLNSFYILSLRYLTIVREHIWKEWLVFSVIYLCYGFVLLMNWDPQIAYVTGCFKLDDDFNNTCSLTEEKAREEVQLNDNAKYSYFMSSMFILLCKIQATMVMNRDIVYFVNEHRNGWYTTGSFYLMRTVFDLVPMVPVILVYVYIINIYEPVRPGIYWNLVFILTLSLLTAQGMCHIYVLIANQNVTIITMILLGTFNIYQMLSNFFIKLQRVHYLYLFLSNFVISRFTIESIMLLEYGFERCAPKEIQPVLYLMDLKDQDYYWCVGMILFNLVIYRLVAIALLVSKVNSIDNRRQRVNRVGEYQNKIVNSKAQLKADLGPSVVQFCIQKFKV